MEIYDCQKKKAHHQYGDLELYLDTKKHRFITQTQQELQQEHKKTRHKIWTYTNVPEHVLVKCKERAFCGQL